MEFFEVLEKRVSVRKFKEKEVEEEKLQKLLEAVNSAPSAGNMQAYEIILVKDAEGKERLAKTCMMHGFESAPIVLVFLANAKRNTYYGERGKNLYCVQDATIAASYLQLAAVALGLASVWIGAFDEKKVAEAVGCKEGMKPVAVIPVGYAAESPGKSPRRKLKELVHREKV